MKETTFNKIAEFIIEKSLKKHSDCMYWVSCFISANRYITWASQKEAFRPKLSKPSITITWKVTFVHEVKHTQGS